MKISITIITILLFFTLAGCSSLMYGEEHMALTSKDRLLIQNADDYLNVPNIRSDKNILIYFVAFDGTNNDCSRVNLKKERCTIVGEYFDKVSKSLSSVDAGNYYPGPSGINAIYCFTCIRTAEKAINDLDKAFGLPINDLTDVSEVRVVVMGFSRGAAIARHFINRLSSKYNTSLVNSSKVRIRTVALLYDTVDTYISGDMNIGLSGSTDYMVHIISRDENRKYFPVIRDEVSNLVDSTEGVRYSDNYVEIQLPGAHSDIGGSYVNGVGVFYRAIADKFFYDLGLLNKKHFQIPNYSMTAGRHDSRGFIDKIILRTKPQSAVVRNHISVSGHVYSLDEKLALKKRLDKMLIANVGRDYSLSTRDTTPLVFFVKRNGLSLEVHTNDHNITDLSTTEEEGFQIINYSSTNPPSTSKLQIPEELYREIKNDKFTKIEFILLEGTDYRYFVYVADEKEVLRVN